MSMIHPQFGVGPQVSESLDGAGAWARRVKVKSAIQTKHHPPKTPGFSPFRVSRYNRPTCYHARDIQYFPFPWQSNCPQTVV